MVLRVTYVMVGNEAPSYFVKMLHGIHIYFKHNRIVPQGLLYIYVYIYIYIYIYTSETVEGMSVETAAMVGIARSATVLCQLCWLIVEIEFCSYGLISLTL